MPTNILAAVVCSFAQLAGGSSAHKNSRRSSECLSFVGGVHQAYSKRLHEGWRTWRWSAPLLLPVSVTAAVLSAGARTHQHKQLSPPPLLLLLYVCAQYPSYSCCRFWVSQERADRPSPSCTRAQCTPCVAPCKPLHVCAQRPCYCCICLQVLGFTNTSRPPPPPHLRSFPLLPIRALAVYACGQPECRTLHCVLALLNCCAQDLPASVCRLLLTQAPILHPFHPASPDCTTSGCLYQLQVLTLNNAGTRPPTLPTPRVLTARLLCFCPVCRFWVSPTPAGLPRQRSSGHASVRTPRWQVSAAWHPRGGVEKGTGGLARGEENRWAQLGAFARDHACNPVFKEAL
jgi:hypothetical protein